MTGQSIQYTRSRNGYDPQEVNAVTIELQKQIADLKQQNASLANTIAQYDDKVRQIAENAERLQAERTKESLRLTNFLNQAAQMAEQTAQDALSEAKEVTDNAKRDASRIIATAQQEAEKIRNQVQADFAIAQKTLTALDTNVQAMRQSNEQYTSEANARLTEMVTRVSDALAGIQVAPIFYAPSAPEVPHSLPHVIQTEVDSADTAQTSDDPYAAYVEKIREIGHQPSFIPTPPNGFPKNRP